jgi:hypothetical protein
VTLRDEDVGRIGDYVKPWLREVVGEMVPHLERGDFGNQLLERLIRIEEELKAQRALMDERFGFMADRFTAVDKRFEAVDKRFEAVDKRFEAVDKRFEDLIGQMNARFGAMDKRFEDMVGQMNARFETVDRRFEESRAHTDSRFTTLTWMIGVGFAVITSLTTLFALLA